MRSAYYRVGEAATRPEALEKLKQSLNSSNTLAAYVIAYTHMSSHRLTPGALCRYVAAAALE